MQPKATSNGFISLNEAKEDRLLLKSSLISFIIITVGGIALSQNQEALTNSTIKMYFYNKIKQGQDWS